MLTTPKIKDFVTRPAQKYERMFNAMNHGSSGAQDGTTSLEDLFPSGDAPIGLNNNIGSFKLDETNKNNKNNMKEELKQYLKTHLRDNGSANDSLEPFDISSSATSFTPF